MRTLTLSAMLLLAVGCEANPGFYDYQSSVYSDTRGVALTDAGVAQVGMNGTTCEVTTYDGMIGTDYDYPGSNDVVQDGVSDENGDVTVVVTSEKGAHIQRPNGDWFAESEDFDMNDPVDAVILPDFVGVLDRSTAERCSVKQVGGSSNDVTALSAATCSGNPDMTADRDSGTIFVGSDAGVEVVQGGTTEIIYDEGASIVAWDATAQVLYAATPGDSVLRGLERDGTQRWTVDLGAGITDLDAASDLGRAIVGVRYADGSGSIVTVDGYSGMVIGTMGVGEAPTEIDVSDDGEQLAAKTSSSLDFFAKGLPVYTIDPEAMGWDFEY